MNSKNQDIITITKLSHDGRGIGHIDGKTYFIENALPEETVQFKLLRGHKKFSEGIATEIITSSPLRIKPRCHHFGVCGGCQLQHMSTEFQLQYKQSMVLELLHHIAKISPTEILPPKTKEDYGYRNKARLGVKYVEKKKRLLIGFREVNGRYLACLTCCETLHPKVGKNLPLLAEMIQSLSCFKQIPQIEVALGYQHECALIFRHLEPLTDNDLAILKKFGEENQMMICLQAGGYDSIYPLFPPATHYQQPSYLQHEQVLSHNSSQLAPQLHYQIPSHDITITFHPGDFIQVNAAMNLAMIDTAIQLLEIQPSDTILDLFCGLGNFTLPIAKYAHQVTGIEGDEKMVKKALKNAKLNHLDNVQFFSADLFKTYENLAWACQHYDKILLDPPRAGAEKICQNINLFSAQKIVYISCNPATLARDAGEIVKQGYTLAKLGIINMFPQTSHVETIALFTR